jgi:hypothetical protein
MDLINEWNFMDLYANYQFLSSGSRKPIEKTQTHKKLDCDHSKTEGLTSTKRLRRT